MDQLNASRRALQSVFAQAGLPFGGQAKIRDDKKVMALGLHAWEQVDGVPTPKFLHEADAVRIKNAFIKAGLVFMDMDEVRKIDMDAINPDYSFVVARSYRTDRFEPAFNVANDTGMTLMVINPTPYFIESKRKRLVAALQDEFAPYLLRQSMVRQTP